MLAWSFNCFQLLLFHKNILNLEMKELVSGTLAFLRHNPHHFFFFLSVQDSEQTASLTENIKSQLKYIQIVCRHWNQNLKYDTTLINPRVLKSSINLHFASFSCPYLMEDEICPFFLNIPVKNFYPISLNFRQMKCL